VGGQRAPGVRSRDYRKNRFSPLSARSQAKFQEILMHLLSLLPIESGSLKMIQRVRNCGKKLEIFSPLRYPNIYYRGSKKCSGRLRTGSQRDGRRFCDSYLITGLYRKFLFLSPSPDPSRQGRGKIEESQNSLPLDGGGQGGGDNNLRFLFLRNVR